MENQAQTSQLKSYYNCEHCGRIYKRKSSLQHHITIKHEEITLLKVKLQNEHLQLKYSLMMDQVMCFKQHLYACSKADCGIQPFRWIEWV